MTTAEARFHYPLGNLVPDYLRAGAGFGLSMVPLPAALGAHPLVLLIVLGFAGLFGSFGVTTFMRQKSTVIASDAGIRIEGLRSKAIRWEDVQGVDLRYFSTRKEKDKGWLQLKVIGPNGTVKVDSNLDDFDGLLRWVVTAITRHDLSVTLIGRENFASKGQPLPTREDTA
ncbi:MAG: hypothetical protein KDC18_17060 [Alphaproteobacteria bacterium]|nr:hypothetical protein [Alphaproteobacteria bacterium]MCB9930155.1 hypothetical protein [Alphaproteobacteria bacterium]